MYVPVRSMLEGTIALHLAKTHLHVSYICAVGDSTEVTKKSVHVVS